MHIRSFAVIATVIAAALSGCASADPIIRTAEDSGLRKAEIVTEEIDNPTVLGCSPEDSVAYRLRGLETDHRKQTEVIVCCGAERHGCEKVDTVADY